MINEQSKCSQKRGVIIKKSSTYALFVSTHPFFNKFCNSLEKNLISESLTLSLKFYSDDFVLFLASRR